MESKKSITKNYLYNLAYQILAIILPIITTPYLARVLGAENIGIYSYTLSIVTYFILFGSLGIAMYGQREIAYLQDNKIERSKRFFEILFLRFITLSISLLVYYIIFIMNHNEYNTYYKILILEIVANAIDISWFFQGIEEFKKIVIRNVIIRLISIILIFTLVKNKNDLIYYFILYVISNVIGNLSLWTSIPKYIEKVKIKQLQIIKHLKPTIGLFIPQIAVQIYTVLDKTMIGTLVTEKSEVGFYEQAQKVVKIILTIVTSFGTVMIPRMASTFAKDNNEKLIEYMKKSFQFVLMMIFPLMFGIISVSSKFVPAFLGPGYDKVIYLIIIISPILLAIGLSNVVGTQYLLPTKQQKKYTISVVLGAIVNFILNLILIRICKSIGASIATVVAESVVTITQFYLVRHEIKIKEVFKLAKKYLVASVLMFIVSILIGKLIENNILSIVVQVIVSATTYFAILLVMKDQLLRETIDTIKVKYFNKK